MDKKVFELMEWRHKHYEHVRYVTGTMRQAKEVQDKLNKGYTGSHYILKEGSQ